MRVLTVPVADRPESKTALQVAFKLAAHIGANVVGAHLRPHRDHDNEYQSGGLPLFSSPKKAWLDKLVARDSDSAARRSHRLFNQLAEDAGFKLAKRAGLKLNKGAIWQERVGTPSKLMAISGPLSDLTVVTRPSSKSSIARLFAYAALLNSSRPVMLLPSRQTKLPGKRIAIGWNQSPEAASVVASCMPLLQQAEQVSIISAGIESRVGPKSKHLRDYLKHYGIDARVYGSRGKNEEQELLAAYQSTKSDLLLMGAYSRARLREKVFGGMTQHILTKASIPVIMQHA